MSRVQGVAVLGSTGSIGTTALRVLARHPDRFRVTALTAHRSQALLAAQVAEWKPAYAGLVDPEAGALHAGWGEGTACLIAAATAPGTDIVLNAVVGAAGLDATLAALHAGKRVALANKESLVVAGSLVLDALRTGGGALVPVDSEHSAILQCLAGRAPHEIKRLVLTASGGPFREWPADRVQAATLADALNHPTWSMGRKITVDSASLANKALEVIEAHFLFGIPYDRIDVVVHPQSIVHSMVEYEDGSMLAQLGNPDMRTPIAHALAHPERIDSGVAPLSLADIGRLEFEAPDLQRFPCLRLAREALRGGGAAPCVLNAANEVAVAAFLERALRFTDIARVADAALQAIGSRAAGAGIDEVREIDREARACARDQLARCPA